MLGDIPESLKSASSKDLNKDIARQIHKWITSQNRGPLILHGEPGRGKTYASATVFNWFKKNYPQASTRFISVPHLYQTWMANQRSYSENKNILNQLCDSMTLIIDDLGIRKPSDGFLDFLYCIIDDRANKPNDWTIYTTNCSSQELTDLYSARIVSRLNGGTIIKMEGNDLRKKM